MKKISFILAAFMLLSISFMFSQAPPQLLFPINGQSVDPDQPTFQIEQYGWELTGTFEIYVDTVPIDPLNPGIPVYVGPLQPPPPPGGRTLLEYHMADLMDEQAYYWFVRYSNGVDYWASVVQNFITGVSTQTKYTIQGNIQSQSPLVSVGGVNITCPGACYPAWVNTLWTTGYYKFQVLAGGTYTVTTSKAGYYFNPFLPQTYSNISANQTQNYWIISMNPNKSGLIYPGYGSVNLPVMLPHLQWEYIQSPAFSLPTSFDLWFGPMGASVPIEEISYEGDGLYTYEFVPPSIPLEYGTTYEWKVIPKNIDGQAEDIETWTFTTEVLFTLLSPSDFAVEVPQDGLMLEWVMVPWTIDSFFDVYMDTDPSFRNPPFYSGQGEPLPGEPTIRRCPAPSLAGGTTYYWRVELAGGGQATPPRQFAVTGNQPPPPGPVIMWSPVNWDTTVIPKLISMQFQKNPQDLGMPDSFFDVFDVEVSPSPDFPEPIFHPAPVTETDVDGDPGTTDYQCVIPELLENTDYYWRVRQTSTWTGLSSVSETFMFTTLNIFEDDAPEAFAPPDESDLVMVWGDTDTQSYYSPAFKYDYGLNDVYYPPPNFEGVPAEQRSILRFITDLTDGSINISFDVPPGHWWIIANWGAGWQSGSPYPSMGGPVLLPPIPINEGDKANSMFYVILVEGENYDPTLPVELSSFDAVVTAEQFVNLTWVVQSETNLMGYYILRNDTDILNNALTLNPDPITDGNAIGTQITYHYTDAQVEQDNTYYYWLNSVDLDGSTHFYGPVSVTISGDGPDDPIPIIPLKTELLNAYPNPFFSLSSIPYAMKTAGDVKIDIYNCKGQLIWTHSETGKQPGYHKVVWDGKDQSGKALGSGIYYYLMTSGKYSAGKKVVLMK